MLLRMLAARFRRLVPGVGGKTVRRVGVMRRRLVLAFFEVLRGFTRMFGRVVVLVRGVLVVVGCGMLVTRWATIIGQDFEFSRNGVPNSGSHSLSVRAFVRTRIP